MDVEGYENGTTAISDDLGNVTSSPAGNHIPTTNNILSIIVYSILFIIGATGNLTVFGTLLRAHRRSRVSLLLMHLTVADLIVTFLMIPMEIMWRVTNQWQAGNLMCKFFMTIRAFGPYLSSNVLVCITLDRFFVIMYPLRIGDAKERGKTMLAVAWFVSFFSSLPQAFVFRVLQHPLDPNFHQCVTFGAFSSTTQEKFYNLFCLAAVYFLPLSVILMSYASILYKITARSRETTEDSNGEDQRTGSNRVRLRKSDVTTFTRARSRTLKMTVTIVAAFFFCWTPYVIMTLWYVIDRYSAEHVDKQVQEILFLMAVSNSCVNPIVYGSFAIKCKSPCDCLGLTTRYGNIFRRRSTSVDPNNGEPETEVNEMDLHEMEENADVSFFQRTQKRFLELTQAPSRVIRPQPKLQCNVRAAYTTSTGTQTVVLSCIDGRTRVITLIPKDRGFFPSPDQSQP